MQLKKSVIYGGKRQRFLDEKGQISLRIELIDATSQI
jgi:hypothetical protein